MKAVPHVLIIDVSALFHRAWHALPPLTTPAGEPISAIFGLTNLLIRVLSEVKPEYVVAALDTPARTFRHELSEAYKATRPEPPDELRAQFPKIPDLLSALGIVSCAAEGFEADDIIATIAERVAKKKTNTNLLILSSDRDLWQLLTNSRARVLALKRGVSELERIDAKRAQRAFGVPPERIPDFKALAGDPSDNILGVRGIGEKTASALLQTYRSLEGIFEAIEKEDQAQWSRGLNRFAARLRAEQERVFLNRALATVRRDAPLATDLREWKWQGIHRDRATPLFVRWGFRALLERLGAKGGSSAQSNAALAAQTRSQIEEATRAGLLPQRLAELERALIAVFAAMTRAGIKVDIEYLARLSKEFHDREKSLAEELFAMAGERFNPASSDQVGRVLQKVLGEAAQQLRKTGGGKPSTAMRALKRFSATHPFVEKILAWREIAKLLSTYVDALPRAVSPRDGRIHTTFLQFGALTGRISSMKPNLQNIPVRSEYGRMVRDAFVADRGRVFLSADYSQIELRIIAHLSQDPILCEAFLRGDDIHALTASKLFHVPREQVTPAMRAHAKTINFGVLYGMGPRRLAEESDMPFEEAKVFIEEYFGQFPHVAAWIEKTKRAARECGYVDTMFGRRRLIPEIHSPRPMLRAQGERAAVNTPMQGTAADIVKFALVGVADLMRRHRREGVLLLQVHDELLFEVNRARVDTLAPSIRDVMQSIAKLSVPLEVTLSVGSQWGNMARLRSAEAFGVGELDSH